MTSVSQIVVIPLSGYANRLQAIASAWALASRIGARLSVAWAPDAVAPAGLDIVIDPRWAREHGTGFEDLARIGLEPFEFAPYLDDHGTAITLAGFDRGEQAFMPELAHLLEVTRASTLVIRAGGHFSLVGDGDAAKEERSRAYASMPLHPAVEEHADRLAGEHAPFLGLHLRFTDRSTQAPSSRAIERALDDLRAASGLDSLVIASDTARARDAWLERAARLGLRAWSAGPASMDRADAASCHPALVDWMLLQRAWGIVYSAASSFGEEATIAGRTWTRSRALAPSSLRSIGLRAGVLAEAAVTYPRRHGWLGRA